MNILTFLVVIIIKKQYIYNQYQVLVDISGPTTSKEKINKILDRGFYRTGVYEQ